MIGQNYTVTRNVGRAGQSLSDGFVSTTTGAVYTVDASVNAMIRSATFYNDNTIIQTLNIYVTRNGGTRRQIYKVILDSKESFDLVVSGEVMCLSGGDALDADTTTVSSVSYVITGQTEDA